MRRILLVLVVCAMGASAPLSSVLAQPAPPDTVVDKGEPIAEGTEPAKAEPPETEKKGGGGCGCRANGAVDSGLWGAVLIALVWRRRRG